jgi:small conductance mechanosensitive channel
MMKFFSSFCFSLSLVIMINMTAFTVFAKDTAEKTELAARSVDSLLAESNTLLEEITDIAKYSAALKSKFKNVPEIDRSLFLSLVFNMETELRKKLDQLISVQQELDKQNADSETLRLKIAEICAEQSEVLQQEIHFFIRFIAKMREQSSQDDVMQMTIERSERNLNDLIAAWQNNIEREQALNIEVSEDVEKLSQFVQLRAIAATGRIRIVLDEIKMLNARLDDASEEEQQAISKQLRELEQQKKFQAENLEAMIGVMNGLGMNTTRFGQMLVIATGDILNEQVTTEAVLGIFQALTRKALSWFKENLPLIIFKVVMFFAILLAFKILARIIRHMVEKAVSNSKMKSTQLLNEFLASISSKIVMLIGVIIALSQIGIEIGPLLAGMGVMGFVVGFALQDSLSNFASGLMILIYRPFDVGDFVEVASISGEVKQMNLVSTTILTPDRKKMIIPNTKIWGDIIINVSAEKLRRIDFVFGIGYADDIGRAEQVLQEITDAHELILDTPKPVIKVHTLGASSVDFIVRPWVKRQDYWEVYWDITRQVKERFDAAGISIPYPQSDVHLFPAAELIVNNKSALQGDAGMQST